MGPLMEIMAIGADLCGCHSKFLLYAMNETKKRIYYIHTAACCCQYYQVFL